MNNSRETYPALGVGDNGGIALVWNAYNDIMDLQLKDSQIIAPTSCIFTIVVTAQDSSITRLNRESNFIYCGSLTTLHDSRMHIQKGPTTN